MSIIIRLQNLPWTASAMDIRRFFFGLQIPDGGVHIVGGDKGDAFIAFSSDEDARKAMMLDGGQILDNCVKLYLSSKSEMQTVISVARTSSDTDTVNPNPKSMQAQLKEPYPVSQYPQNIQANLMTSGQGRHGDWSYNKPNLSQQDDEPYQPSYSSNIAQPPRRSLGQEGIAGGRIHDSQAGRGYQQQPFKPDPLNNQSDRPYMSNVNFNMPPPTFNRPPGHNNRPSGPNFSASPSGVVQVRGAYSQPPQRPPFPGTESPRIINPQQFNAERENEGASDFPPHDVRFRPSGNQNLPPQMSTQAPHVQGSSGHSSVNQMPSTNDTYFKPSHGASLLGTSPYDKPTPRGQSSVMGESPSGRRTASRFSDRDASPGGVCRNTDDFGAGHGDERHPSNRRFEQPMREGRIDDREGPSWQHRNEGFRDDHLGDNPRGSFGRGMPSQNIPNRDAGSGFLRNDPSRDDQVKRPGLIGDRPGAADKFRQSDRMQPGSVRDNGKMPPAGLPHLPDSGQMLPENTRCPPDDGRIQPGIIKGPYDRSVQTGILRRPLDSGKIPPENMRGPSDERMLPSGPGDFGRMPPRCPGDEGKMPQRDLLGQGRIPPRGPGIVGMPPRGPGIEGMPPRGTADEGRMARDLTNVGRMPSRDPVAEGMPQRDLTNMGRGLEDEGRMLQRGPGDVGRMPPRGPGDVGRMLQRGGGDIGGMPHRGSGDEGRMPHRGPGDEERMPHRGPGDEERMPHRGPGDEGRMPPRGFADVGRKLPENMRGLQDDRLPLRGPVDIGKMTPGNARGILDDGRMPPGNTRELIDERMPLGNMRGPQDDKRIPAGNIRGPDGRLPPGSMKSPHDDRIRPGNIQGQDDRRMPTGNIRGPSDEGRLLPGNMRGPLDDARMPLGNMRGSLDGRMPPGDMRGPPNNGRMPQGDMRGPPDNGRLLSGNTRGPGDGRMPPGDMRGPPDNGRLPPGNTRGPGDGRMPSDLLSLGQLRAPSGTTHDLDIRAADSLHGPRGGNRMLNVNSRQDEDQRLPPWNKQSYQEEQRLPESRMDQGDRNRPYNEKPPGLLKRPEDERQLHGLLPTPKKALLPSPMDQDRNAGAKPQGAPFADPSRVPFDVQKPYLGDPRNDVRRNEDSRVMYEHESLPSHHENQQRMMKDGLDSPVLDTKPGSRLGRFPGGQNTTKGPSMPANNQEIQQGFERQPMIEQDADVNGDVYRLVTNLPRDINYKDVRRFFYGCTIMDSGLKMINDDNGNRNGEAYIMFRSDIHSKKAMERNGTLLRAKRIGVVPVRRERFDIAIDSFHPEKSAALIGASPEDIANAAMLLQSRQMMSGAAPPENPMMQPFGQQDMPLSISDRFKLNERNVGASSPGQLESERGGGSGLDFYDERHNSQERTQESRRGGRRLSSDRREREWVSQESGVSARREGRTSSEERRRSPVLRSRNRSPARRSPLRRRTSKSRSPSRKVSRNKSPYIVVTRLPKAVTRQNIRDLLRGLKIARKGDAVHLEVNQRGSCTGCALVEMEKEDFSEAVNKRNCRVGSQMVRIFEMSKSEYNERIERSRDHDKKHRGEKRKDDKEKKSTEDKDVQKEESGQVEVPHNDGAAEPKSDANNQERSNWTSPDDGSPQSVAIKRKLSESDQCSAKRVMVEMTSPQETSGTHQTVDQKADNLHQSHRSSVQEQILSPFKDPMGGKSDGPQLSWAEEVIKEEKEAALNAARDIDCVMIVGLPTNCADFKIRQFFKNDKIQTNGIHLIRTSASSVHSVGFVEFINAQECKKALWKNRAILDTSVLAITGIRKAEMLKKKAESLGECIKKMEAESTPAHKQPLLNSPAPLLQQPPAASPDIKPLLHDPDSRPAPMSLLCPGTLASKPPSDIAPAGCAIKASNFAYRVTLQEIASVFREFNPKADEICLRYSPTGQPTGDALIPFFNASDANKARNALNNTQQLGRRIFLCIL